MEKPSAYQGDEAYIFVCYAHEDADAVYPEIEWLQAERVNVWYDEGISLGTEWTEALADAIEGCTKFLFFVTPSSVTREHCRRELNFAQEEGREVMAVHLKPTEVPAGLRLSLNNRQAIFKQELGEPQYRHALLKALGSPGGAQPLKVEKPTLSISPRWVIYAVAALLIVVGGGWWLRAPVESPPAALDTEAEPIDEPATGVLQNSIAVLPFDNLSPEPDHAYFAAGIYDEIVTQLGKVRGLSVIARAAMLRYADSDRSVAQIASELNVETIMSGSVRYSADQVRVTVQLVDAATGTQLWSDGYQERLEDVFDIQMAIARRIASTLEVRISPDDPVLASKPLTANAAAYAHYLRASSLAWGGLNPVGLVYAELDRAIDADPEFASAYATKAFYQSVMGMPESDRQKSLEDIQAWRKEVRQNARRALDIDPNEARALLTLGLRAIANTRFDEGVVLVERTYELAPNDIYTLNFLANVRTMQDRWPDVLALVEKMMALDPLDFYHPFLLSNRAWWLEEYATAAEVAQQAIALMPDAFYGYLAAAQAAAGQGDAPTAVRNLEQAIEFGRQSGGLALVVASAASVYHQLNLPGKAREMLDELDVLATSHYTPPDLRLLAYVGSSDADMIVYWLTRAIQDEFCTMACWGILHLSDHQAFDGVRDHPEFRAVVESI